MSFIERSNVYPFVYFFKLLFIKVSRFISRYLIKVAYTYYFFM